MADTLHLEIVTAGGAAVDTQAAQVTLPLADGETGDQKRVTTPERARELGSDYIVVGRPITQADDPVAAYRRCVAAFVG